MHHIFDRIVEARGRRIREELRETFRGCRRRCRRRQMYCQPPYSPSLRHRWSGALLAFQGKFFAEPSETSEAPFWRLLPLHSVSYEKLVKRQRGSSFLDFTIFVPPLNYFDLDSLKIKNFVKSTSVTITPSVEWSSSCFPREIFR